MLEGTCLDDVYGTSSQNPVHAWLFFRSNAYVSSLEPFAFLELSGCDFWEIPVLVEDTRTLDLDFTLFILCLYNPFFILVIESHLNIRQRESHMTTYTMIIVEPGAEQDSAKNATHQSARATTQNRDNIRFSHAVSLKQNLTTPNLFIPSLFYAFRKWCTARHLQTQFSRSSGCFSLLVLGEGIVGG
jgi:hypothetical protein